MSMCNDAHNIIKEPNSALHSPKYLFDVVHMMSITKIKAKVFQYLDEKQN